MIHININTEVKVKLTLKGRSILNRTEFIGVIITNGEYHVLQLWELMAIFGKHIYNGCEIPFVNNEIIFDETDNKVTY